MDLLQRFKEHLQNNLLFDSHDQLLIAVSGGIDSVVLCHLCKAAGYSFSIAHCNFALRGAESQRDELFVKELAESLDAALYVKSFATTDYAGIHKVSIQVAARQLRYAWFEELLAEKKQHAQTKKSSAYYILTAHHKDDNIETSLMNFCKGTGIAGLRGILTKNGHIVRPLLFASKQDILQYATEMGLKWVDDSSNEEVKYTRNYVRHHLIPAMEKVFPGVKQNLHNNIHRFTETEILFQQAVSLHKKKLITVNEESIQIPVLKLQQAHPLDTIIFEIIKDYGFHFQQVSEVKKLLKSDTGKYITSDSHRILRNRAWLHISKLQDQQISIIVIEPGQEKIPFDGKDMAIRQLPALGQILSTDQHIVQFDLKRIVFPLMLRKWKQGDYFYPLGMQKKKKVARFLIDQKLSLQQKEQTWVIESEKRIIWVVGLRIDNRFKIQPSTKDILQISLSTP